MITFTTPLDCRMVPNHPKNWVILRDLLADYGDVDGKGVARIKRGFVTDFGSVPWIGRLVVSPQGVAKPDYVLHDWNYATQQFSQVVADAMLLEGMAQRGVNVVQRSIVHRALRMFGWLAWNKHARARKKALAAGLPYPALVDPKIYDRRRSERNAETKIETNNQETKAE